MYDTITLIYSLNHPISFIQLTLDVYCVTLFLMRKIYHVLNLLLNLSPLSPLSSEIEAKEFPFF